MKEKVQLFGRALSGMVMPNIGAFIAWGLITALFISTGWCPNETLAQLVDPMSKYLLPLLIGYTGGKVVGDHRGGVIGAIGTFGVIVGSDIPMFIGAMIMGPLSAWILKKFDKLVEGKIKAGFEMLVNNFSLGIIGAILACAAMYLIAPAVTVLNSAMEAGVGFFVDHGLLPLASIFIEPAKVLFLNNAINHGILSPMGIQGSAKSSAPGAVIIHFLGGIHEIYFPYILMNPLLLLAVIAGGASGIFTFTMFNVGLTGTASPGSIISILMMCERHCYVGLILGVLISAAVSFAISLLILRFAGKDTSLEEATAKKDDMKNQSKGIKSEQASAQGEIAKTGTLKIAFACDAGMGSSAMGATVLKKKITQAGLADIEVSHTPVSSIPADVNIVVTHEELGERAAHSNPNAKLILITNFLAAPEYDTLIEELKMIRQ